MLRKKARHPGYGEIVPLAAQARAVVVDERPGEHRHEAIVTQAPLHDSFGDMDAPNMPRLSPLHNIELVKALGAVSPGYQFLVCLCDVGKRGGFVSLCARFPPNATDGGAVALIEPLE